jgi:aspartyl-tRNA(Asn)/glutamyl-tRNA(Gln) amidotransferase subunit C
MKVNDKLVERLAHLSRLEFDADSKTKMKSDFEKILGFVSKLESVDTSTTEPLVYMSSETNVLRVDEVKNELSQKDALKNAGGKDTDYIRVPKVIKK